MCTPDWTNLPADHPLCKFAANLPAILKDAGHNEMYGVELRPAEDEKQPAPHTTLLILQKFLRANAADLPAAQTQLTGAPKWRKEYQPLQARDELFEGDRFGGLGYVTKLSGAKDTPNDVDVAAFNIYGAAAKDPKKAFGDTDKFVRWRVALMELTLAQLKLDAATRPIPDYGHGPDPYQALQVHDYLSVSFFRQPAEIKSSSSRIIELFQKHYPETVSYKYFVNVPIVMQWMMGAMKMLMSKDSIQKMTWLTYGEQLVQYVGEDVPKEYGGKGEGLEVRGLTPEYGGTGDGSKKGQVAKEEEGTKESAGAEAQTS